MPMMAITTSSMRSKGGGDIKETFVAEFWDAESSRTRPNRRARKPEDVLNSRPTKKPDR